MIKSNYDNPMRRNAYDVPGLCITQCTLIEKESRLMLSTPEIYHVGRILLTGCGDSYIAALAAKYAFEELAGIPTEVVSTIDLARHIHPSVLAGGKGTTMVVAVSNSGRVTRVAEAVSRARKYGCLTVGITGDDQSPLAQAAEKVLKLEVPKFEAGNGVRSYMVSMLSMISIAIRMGEVKGRYLMTAAEGYRGDICAYAQRYEEEIAALDDQMFALAQQHTGKMMFDFVASGPNFATAYFSWAKIQEATGDFTCATSTEDWMHGQCFLKRIDQTFTMLFAHADSQAQSRTKEVLDCMAQMQRNPYLLIDAEDAQLPQGVTGIFVPSCPHEWLAPLLNYLPFSLFSGYLCELEQEQYGRGCRDNWKICGTTKLITESKLELY